MPPKFSRTTAEDRAESRYSERANLLNLDSDEEGSNIFSGPNSQSHEAKGNDNIARVKSEVKNVVNIMQNNISKVLDRGAKIDDLHEKSENLEMSAFQFRSGSRKLQRKLWWQNCRLKLVFIFVVIIILVIIIVPIVLKNKKKT
ncbi:vesicle-associated membrane protein 4 [Exaiptasia diaphana]|uniref:V-SNARE coiled-coil homology domain-containing protein n=1 Tax=Exaiptasia diaphana TaxID=2652724 RepID=A0A913Y741_EXADI|nr:vesicle-associated membrane protein 4 [Exaiptasia diaphana]KXJ19699.1 Vesicle-associated membrane protein 4 [Exaiptasia diaphana]